MPICLLWYIRTVPAEQMALVQLGISTIGAGTFTQVTRTLLVSVMASATILAVVYLAAYRKPEQFQFGYAVAVLLLALAATGSAEMSRANCSASPTWWSATCIPMGYAPTMSNARGNRKGKRSGLTIEVI